MCRQGAVNPINLGNPEEMKILDLARRIISMTGARGSIVFQSLPTDDPKRRRPDIRRAREELGWAPSTSIAEGLIRTIAYFRVKISQPDVRVATGNSRRGDTDQPVYA